MPTNVTVFNDTEGDIRLTERYPALSALDRTKGRGNEAAEGLKDLVSALH